MRETRPSLTARGVALARDQLSRAQTPDGDPDAEHRLYATLRPTMWWPRTARRRQRMEARTRFFDDEVLEALASGTKQVVIVGAGYDGRALRFRAPGVQFFELDHPATQGDKRRRVEALGVPLDHLTFASIDLMRERLGEVLSGAGHDPAQPSLFVCEGLLLYLSGPVVEQLLRDLRSRAAPGSRLAVSTREDLPGGSDLTAARGWARRLLLAVIGEPRRSSFAVGEFGQLLEQTGWRVVREVTRGAQPGERRRRLLLSAEPQ